MDNVIKAVPFPEYPRPQLKRKSWLNLNGYWQYAITNNDAMPKSFDGDILVPYSPECALSGVHKNVGPCDTLWYRRSFLLPPCPAKGRVLLHFGAVDQFCEIFVNGARAGSHSGGYTAFTPDITELVGQGENELTVRVKDASDTSYHSRGKQKLKRGGIWYTPQSGIWQTVWLETVPKRYIERLIIKPLFDEKAVEVTAISDADEGTFSVSSCGALASGPVGSAVRLAVPDAGEWTPENPTLCELSVTFGEDKVQSYFGLRKFEIRPDENGVKRIFLNNRPYFCCGVLDQGYWQDGLYTPPSDDAFVADIEYMKSLGFNTMRKHIKIEPMRWYYHCDRLGMIVWQDMINGGRLHNEPVVTWPVLLGFDLKDDNYRLFARDDAEGRSEYYAELSEMLTQLQNVVSLGVWVPFNEGWGQFDAKKAYDFVKLRDDSRLIDHASGWHDQGAGDFRSRHVYFTPYRFRKDRLERAVILSEFGGYSMRVVGHESSEKNFGYRVYKEKSSLVRSFRKLFTGEILPAKHSGLAACIYTQVSDVEDEQNGFFSYDRQCKKLLPEDVSDVIRALCD